MEISAGRLRHLALFFLLTCLAIVILRAFSTIDLDPPKIVETLLVIGVGLIILAEISPFLKTFKVAGIEIQFIESLNGNLNNLESRVGEVELALRKIQLTAPITVEDAPAPSLNRPIIRSNDQNKGRFGGLANRDGFSLHAEFVRSVEKWVEVKLVVIADPKIMIGSQDSVEFFLHQTFQPDRIKVPFVGHRAQFQLYSFGGFTVGVWIAAHRIELELDLATIPGAPRIIREL